jgi:hypothetical protein
MKPWVKIGLVAATFVVAAALAAFLIGQGLNKAGTWATILGLPIAIVSAAAGVWAAVLASRALREARSPTVPVPAPLKKAHVELVDAALDPDVVAGISGAEDAALTAERPMAKITNVKPRAGAIDFKFINRGDAAAVLHQFTIRILDFQLDTTPLLEYSYFPEGDSSAEGDESPSGEFYYGTTLKLKISNFGWGSALGFNAALTYPLLADLFPQAALSIDFAEIESGSIPTFTLPATGADRAVMDRLCERRAALLTKAVTALTEVNKKILRDPDFKILLSFHEQWHIREFFSDYRDMDDDPRQQWHRDYVAGLDSDYLPIRLNMHVEYTDQNGRQNSEDTVALTDFDRSMTEGVLWVGPSGFRYEVHHVDFMLMPGRDAYAVILDPQNADEREYRVSRSIPPGDADRFHVVLASRMSGDFTLRLSFHINGTQVVQSDPLKISLNRPRNARLPQGLSDGTSFELRDGRLELGV